MVVFRIAKEEYIHDLSGYGARRYGGRWNQKGTSVIYTSESRALASLEFLVHIPPVLIPHDLYIATIEIPNRFTPEVCKTKRLPPNWKEFPPPHRLALIGTNWVLQKKKLLLQVPSALVEDEYNILINPDHPDIRYVKIKKIQKYHFDQRLLK